MNIIINTSAFDRFFSLSPDQMLWVFFVDFGWLIVAIFFLVGMAQVYLFYIRIQWEKTHQHIILAIDIPRGNEQSPKAVENILAYLAGAHGSISFFEKWFEGKFQKSFSFEIISLEGYTQFLIHLPLEFRNLVESAVYSQYPDAEISEVDDYTHNLPKNLPDDQYDVWGTEFIQAASEVYPIKCYEEFEHQFGPSETQFKDPMASLMDLFGSLREGEQLWFQMILIPIGFTWGKESLKEINKVLGRKEKAKPDAVSKIMNAVGRGSEMIYSLWGDLEEKKKEDKPRTMLDLTPDEKRKVEGIQLKAGKLGYEAKFRTVYIAPPDKMNKAKVANGLVGYMKQFASLDLNNLKPDIDMTFTKALYFFTKSRLLAKKRKIYTAYIKRSESRGRHAGIFNVEELATIWHFPIEANVKAAMMQKAPGRKADAPAALPLAAETAEPLPDIFQTAPLTRGAVSRAPETETAPAGPPDNLPVI